MIVELIHRTWWDNISTDVKKIYLDTETDVVYLEREPKKITHLYFNRDIINDERNLSDIDDDEDDEDDEEEFIYAGDFDYLNTYVKPHC
jgi:hypothetical protein